MLAPRDAEGEALLKTSPRAVVIGKAPKIVSGTWVDERFHLMQHDAG